MNRNELKKCKNLLDNHQTWECFCNDERMIKSFVSKAYDGLDFDGNFEHKLWGTLPPELYY